MINLAYPASLFSKQKVFEISKNVEKKEPAKVLREKFRIVVLYNNPLAELPASINDMLKKIIGACKFAEGETLMLNQNLETLSLGYIQSRYQPEMILVFGEIHLSNNLSKLKKNVPLEINGTQIIQTDSLENLEKVKGAKGLLWESLQQTLNLK